jgi:hypothetical protein
MSISGGGGSKDWSSINLDGRVDLADEERRRPKTHRAAQETKTHAESEHISKVKRRLEETVHFSFKDKVVDGIKINVKGGGCACQ